MVELIHNDIIIKLRCCFGCEILRVKGLDRNKQIVDAVRLVVTHEHLPEVGVLEYSTESIQTLLENFFPVCHKEQSARLVRILLAEALVV